MTKLVLSGIIFGYVLLAVAQDWQTGFLGKTDFEGNLKGMSAATDWELDFTRIGRAYDSKSRIYNVNEPVFEDAGLQMLRGAKLEGGTRFVNLMPTNKLYETGVHVGDSGFTTGDIIVQKDGRHYGLGFGAKGSGELVVTAVLDGVAQKEQTFNLTADSKRFVYLGPQCLGKKSKDLPYKVEYQFEAAGGAELREFCFADPAEFTSSFSMPGCYQVRDRLSLPADLLQQIPEDDFTVYASFRLAKVDGLYQPVFEQTRRGRWWPNLQLAFSHQHRDHLILWHSRLDRESKNPLLVTDIQAKAGECYEIVLTRKDGTVKLWVNGEKKGEISEVPVENVYSVHLGCGGPEQALNGYLRSFAAWNRALSEEDVEAINFLELREPLPVRLASDSYIRHMARGFEPEEYRFRIHNTTSSPITGLTFVWQLATLTLTQDIGMLQPNGDMIIDVPALINLKPGNYTQTFAVKRGNTTLNEQSMPLTVTPAPTPIEHLQVSPWMQFIPREQGYTMGTVARCAEAMEAGLHWGPYHFRYSGYPRSDHPQDRIYLSKERYGSRFGNSDFYFSNYMKNQMKEVVSNIVERIGFYPALTHIDINNEMTWNFRVNFKKEAVDYAQERFGLDLTLWLSDSRKEMVRPIGRLSPQLAGYPLPENRIIPSDDPLYLWHLDRKRPNGNSESLINQYIASSMKRERPDVQSIVAPVTRRLSIRGYDNRLDIAQTWSYTPGFRVIWKQESLTSHIRYTNIKPSSFPAFLSQNVGPYKAMPSGDIFAASCWASLLRPTAMLVFFQAKEMYQERGKDKEEIDKLLGLKTPTTEEAKKIIREKKISIVGNHPTLVPRVRKLISEELPPLRALLPEWRNYPRRIAVYSSFADRLFTDERWPSDYTKYLAALTRSGVAYDIIFDEDFEREPNLLDKYNMVFFPALQYLYEPAYKALNQFAAMPGNIIVVPENAYTFFQDAVVITDDVETTSMLDEYADIVKVVEKKYGTDTSLPMYIETLNEMVAEASAKHAHVDLWTEILDGIDLDARSFLPHSALNITELDDTQYISVVNDLRTWGSIYGHFKVLPEKGIRQSGKVEFNSTFGKFAYNLRNARQIKIEPAGKDRSKMEITLDGGDAAIILLSDREIGKFKAAMERDGDYICVTGQALDKDNNELAISMPCVITVDGSPDYSGSTLFRNGRFMYRFPFEDTIPKVTIRELATGTTITLD